MAKNQYTKRDMTGALARVSKAAVKGMANVVSVSGVKDPRPFPGTNRSSADALKGDWEKLGIDMRRAAHKVTVGASSK